MSTKNIVDFDTLEVIEDVVEFNEEEHSYTSAIDGREYISATTLLKYFELSPTGYDMVPASILKAKADYGTAVHKALENYINGDDTQLLVPEVVAFEEWLIKNNLTRNDCTSEQQVFNTVYGVAGTIDLQAWNIIADFKTTAALHLVSVMWQLSIYNFLLHPNEVDYNMYELKVFWFQSNGALTVRDVPAINYNTLIDMLESYKQGELTWYDNTLPLATSDKIDQVIKQQRLIKAVKNNLKRLEAEEELLKDAIKKELQDQNRIFAQSPTGVVTLTTRSYTRYDNQKLDKLMRTFNLTSDDYKTTTESTQMNIKEITNRGMKP